MTSLALIVLVRGLIKLVLFRVILHHDYVHIIFVIMLMKCGVILRVLHRSHFISIIIINTFIEWILCR